MFKLTSKPLLALATLSSVVLSLPVAACGTEAFMGTICAFSFNFCPRGYLPADGRLIQINQNSALFSLLGTTYGGDGVSTFALPNLQGRSLVGTGQAPGLSPIVPGQMAGTENFTLLTQNMPVHTHSATTTVTLKSTVNASGGPGNSSNPTGKVWAGSTSRDNIYGDISNIQMLAGAVTTKVDSANTSIEPSGGGQPFNIRSPYIGITYCIVSEGIFPSRP